MKQKIEIKISKELLIPKLRSIIKPSKIEKDKTKYNRKKKHKNKED